MPPGSAAAAGRWPTSRTASRPARTSTGSRPIARSTWRAATGMPPGSTAGPSSWPGSTPRPPTRSTAGSSATRTASRRARSRRPPATSCVRILPPTTTDDLVTGLRLAQAELHALGITSWQDAHVRPEEEERAYVALAGSGELTARVVGALGWDELRGADQIDELVERRARTAAPRYRPTSVKFFADGVLENFSGALLSSYLGRDGRPTGDRGRSLIEPEAFGQYVAQLDALGFQAHVHAIGDRAVRETLDAVAVARRANGPSDTRPHIAHIQLVDPADVERFRRARRGGQRPGRLGRPRGSARVPDPPLPRPGARRPGLPVRLAAARRGAAGDGLGLERLHRRSRCSRSRSRSTGSATSIAGRSRRSCPASGSGSTTRSRPSRSDRRGSTTSRRRSARSRSASRPTWSCSIATCSTGRPARSARRGWWPRSSTASRSTRRPGSRAERLPPRTGPSRASVRHGRMTMSIRRRMSVVGGMGPGDDAHAPRN